MNTTARQPQSRRTGLTLLEMLLALGGTGFVAVAVATMLSAVSHGTTTRTDVRSLAVKRATFSYRIDAAIRSSVQVLAHLPLEQERPSAQATGAP